MDAQQDRRLMDRLKSRWGRVSPSARDAAFATFLTLATQIELLTSDSIEGSLAMQSAAFAVMTISVAWRRSIPLLAAGMVAVGLAVQTLVGEAEVTGGFIAILIVMYSVASYSEVRNAVAGGLMIFAAAFLYPIVEDPNFADEVANTFILVGTWVFGRSIRSRQGRALEAEAETIRVSVERDVQVNSAVAQERGRIARDLHDIVAHGVSMMVLQAGAARQVVRTDTPRSEELLLNVESSGRQALDEMHLMLEVLRAPPAEESPATTNLTIDAISDLANRASGAGMSVQVEVNGNQRPLSQGLEASVYRIVQEALTNAARHGNAKTVDVVVTYRETSLELSIIDDGTTTSGSDVASGSNGLIGMTERAELFGGHLTAGPRSSGEGWAVAVELPTTQPV